MIVFHSAPPRHTGVPLPSEPLSLRHSAAGRLCSSPMPGLGQALSILLHSGKGWPLSQAGCGELWGVLWVFWFVFFFLLLLLVLFFIQLAQPSPLLNKKCFRNKNKIKAQLPEFLRELFAGSHRTKGKAGLSSLAHTSGGGLCSHGAQPQQARPRTAPGRLQPGRPDEEGQRPGTGGPRACG